MVSTMANNVDQRRVVKGHGVKGRRHKVEFKALEDPTIITNVGWQNYPKPWSCMLCLQYVRWCHINNKWPVSRRETHKKNNSTQYTNCLDEHKALMLDVYMAATGSHFPPKNQVPLTMAQMVYVEVVLGVQVN
jgi:hypothetical protein